MSAQAIRCQLTGDGTLVLTVPQEDRHVTVRVPLVATYQLLQFLLTHEMVLQGYLSQMPISADATPSFALPVEPKQLIA